MQPKRTTRTYTPEQKEKSNARVKAWKAAHKDRVSTFGQKYYQVHKEEITARNKKWADANKDRQKAVAKKWYQAKQERINAIRPPRPAPASPEQRKANGKKWRANNRERVLASKKAWEAANPERHKAGHKARNAKYFAGKPEVIRAKRRISVQKWTDANPQRRDLYHSRSHAKRKAKLKDAGSFSLQEWTLIVEQAGHKCVCCGIPEAEAIYRYPKRGEPRRGKLTIDHINPLCKGGTNRIDNIQPTCLPCNMRKHDRCINYLINDTGIRSIIDA